MRASHSGSASARHAGLGSVRFRPRVPVWRVTLLVRRPAFQAGEASSILVRATKLVPADGLSDPGLRTWEECVQLASGAPPPCRYAPPAGPDQGFLLPRNEVQFLGGAPSGLVVQRENTCMACRGSRVQIPVSPPPWPRLRIRAVPSEGTSTRFESSRGRHQSWIRSHRARVAQR